MNIYQPQEPKPRTLRQGINARSTGDLERSSWNDSEVRRSMEYSLRSSEQDIHEISKCLKERNLMSLHMVCINYPFYIPPPVYTPGCMSKQQEQDNKVLRDFAFDAQSALQSYFHSEMWHGWFVAPYFAEGDDTHSTLYIGVFVDEELAQEVIE